MHTLLIIKQTTSFGWNIILRKTGQSGKSEALVASFADLPTTSVLVAAIVREMHILYMPDEIEFDAHNASHLTAVRLRQLVQSLAA
jgi:hypothetical protein